MGVYEARGDGVRMERFGKGRVFYPRCRYCGGERPSMSYRRNVRYVCDECRKVEKVLKATGLFD